MNQNNPRAMEIYQDILDKLGDAVMSDDRQAFSDHIHLPHRLVTQTAATELLHADDIDRQFQALTHALRGMGAETYIRTARKAVFDGPDQIEGSHSCYCLTKNGKLVAPEFMCDAVLAYRDGFWGVVEVRHHMRYATWPEMVPVAAGEL